MKRTASSYIYSIGGDCREQTDEVVVVGSSKRLEKPTTKDGPEQRPAGIEFCIRG